MVLVSITISLAIKSIIGVRSPFQYRPSSGEGGHDVIKPTTPYSSQKETQKSKPFKVCYGPSNGVKLVRPAPLYGELINWDPPMFIHV